MLIQWSSKPWSSSCWSNIRTLTCQHWYILSVMPLFSLIPKLRKDERIKAWPAGKRSSLALALLTGKEVGSPEAARSQTTLVTGPATTSIERTLTRMMWCQENRKGNLIKVAALRGKCWASQGPPGLFCTAPLSWQQGPSESHEHGCGSDSFFEHRWIDFSRIRHTPLHPLHPGGRYKVNLTPPNNLCYRHPACAIRTALS